MMSKRWRRMLCRHRQPRTSWMSRQKHTKEGDSKAKAKKAEATEKEFKAKLQAEKDDVEKMEKDAVQAQAAKDKLDEEAEAQKKKEAGEKDAVAKKERDEGQGVIKEQADKKKVQEAKDEADKNQRPEEKAKEKSEKDQEAAVAKKERDEKDMKTTKDKMQERKLKKDEAVESQDAAQQEKERSTSDLKTAESTLKNGEEEHKEWKITLAKDRKAELEAREKELKLVPYRIRKEQQQKYSATHGAEQKEFMERKRKSDTVEAAWNKEEQAVKAATAQQKMLEGEKKSLFKNLGDAVRTEYRTGKKLKKARDHL